MTFESGVGVSVDLVRTFSTEKRISHREIDRNLRRIAKADRELAIEMGRWFLVARRTDAHRDLGYASFFEYVQRLFGMGVRAAEERLRVAEALESMPVIASALGGGEINYSVARDLTRVATGETETVWLEVARDKTAKEVRELVCGHAPGNLPTDRPDPEREPRELSLKLTPHTYGTFFEAKHALEERLGHRLTDSETMDAMCRQVLAGGAGDGGSKKPPYQVSLTVCSQCDRTWQDSAGHTIEVSPVIGEMARCDAEVLGHVDGEWPEDVALEIPAAVRRMVLARDHHRCTVPGCRAFRALHIHHIRFRSHGGTHDPRNLTTLCVAHHSADHEGQLFISGEAPHELTFTHADGRPYGADPAHVCAEPPRPPPAPARDHSIEIDADALSALTQLGFKTVAARAAIERARVHVCADATLETLVRATLRELR